MAHLYRDTINTVNNQVVEEGTKVEFPELESTSRTAINRALKAETIPAKEGFLEYVYYNEKEWHKSREPATSDPAEMK